MVCGGFACSKNALATLNVLYIVSRFCDNLFTFQFLSFSFSHCHGLKIYLWLNAREVGPMLGVYH